MINFEEIQTFESDEIDKIIAEYKKDNEVLKNVINFQHLGLY